MSNTLDVLWRWLTHRVRRLIPDPVDHDYQRRRRFRERRDRIESAVARIVAD